MRSRALSVIALAFMLILCAGTARAESRDVMADLSYFAGLGDRSTGSPGCEAAAQYILGTFREAGLTEVNTQEFLEPVPEAVSASVEAGGERVKLYPWRANMVYLPVTPDEGLSGPLIYAGDGSPRRFDGHRVEGSIVLMDMASHGNWLNAAMLGAKALIFLGDDRPVKGEFREKSINTPLAFPRFWVPAAEGLKLKQLALGSSAAGATVFSKAQWRNKLVQNCYGLIPGKSPELKSELVVIEAFYDASSYILGLAPGADEATSISMLLSLARALGKQPADRSVLLVATVGNGQALAGMRQFIWAATERKKLLNVQKHKLAARRSYVDHRYELVEKGGDVFSLPDAQDRAMIWEIIDKQAKDEADRLSREIQYRKALSTESPSGPGEQQAGAAAEGGAKPPSALDEADPRVYRRLSWHTSLDEVTAEERPLALKLLAESKAELNAERKELKLRDRAIKSALHLRSAIGDYTPVLFLSLYLSGDSRTMGLTDLGETYPLREQVKRQLRSPRLDELLNKIGREVSSETKLPNFIGSTFRYMQQGGGGAPVPCIRCLGCDVAALASCSSVSLASFDTDLSLWSTPGDTLERLDKDRVEAFSKYLPPVIEKLCSHKALRESCPRGLNGLASLEGQAMFIRQGELFPDQPAPGTIISVVQGSSIFQTMAYRDGTFFLPGLANSRVSIEKLIVEPYGIDPVTGRVAWAADKRQTGKENYRIKVKRSTASTALVMFHCEQTDVVGVMQPQRLGHLTKAEILDAKTEAQPIRYWWSRIDSRDTMAISIFLEKGTRFKLLLSETLLQKEFLLLNNSRHDPDGTGFLIGDPPAIVVAPYQVAEDMFNLLGVRLRNLQKHGITNRYLEDVYKASGDDLERARSALAGERYGQFLTNVIQAWAQLVAVYGEVENTQRDVLAGVMFFVALFVPFAYVTERYIFSFRNIYKQIGAFLAILLATIFAIRGLHPAFQLTYSPMVVIIAFFIVGLSVLVSWIIFMRFEREMAQLKGGVVHGAHAQANKWQAFGAGFTIGATNLNRRRIRTALTCTTLIILTFTVMSFTNVKSIHRPTDTRLSDTSPYAGVLLHRQLWQPLTMMALEDMRLRFPEDQAAVSPRGWIEPDDSSDRMIARIRTSHPDGTVRSAPVEGILGLSADSPAYFQRVVSHGRWLLPGERDAVMLSTAMAKQLGIDPEKDLGGPIDLQGDRYRVVGLFDGNALESLRDLDQDLITPAYLEVSEEEEPSEVEIEAMQSGEEILPMSSRFRYADADATVIVPFDTCIDHGGELKAISILPRTQSPIQVADSLSSWLAFPLFVGDGGLWFHSAGTAIRYQGAANIIIPILIVIFICLNTMIGHVQERQREIATYTSVGLAPTHVGFLFIVEALSLAVFSTVIGYILAQISASLMGNTALFSDLTFNYSSLSSVACMVLVFSVVFAAALYPARLAARMAMPDVNRTWTLPEPEGDVIALNLPFLLKEEEEQGIMEFLAGFFKGHEDLAQGHFTADGTLLDVDSPVFEPHHMPEPVCLLIRASVWLAPFDFGIKQRVLLNCCQSLDNPGYLEISIRMLRLSGERSAWARANKDFIKVLRKQMLLWRLIHARGERVLGE